MVNTACQGWGGRPAVLTAQPYPLKDKLGELFNQREWAAHSVGSNLVLLAKHTHTHTQTAHCAGPQVLQATWTIASATSGVGDGGLGRMSSHVTRKSDGLAVPLDTACMGRDSFAFH